jgi:RNA polymerase sigma factor (sigma-70 family)
MNLARPALGALLERVVAGDVQAWQRLVESHLGFLYALAWRYARGDRDRAAELVLVALEGLRRPDAEGRGFYRLRRYLESRAELGGQSRFTTWLALVAKNLFRDWFREREGRRHLPREIDGLDPLSQALFGLLFWEGLSQAEAWGRLASSQPGLTPGRFEAALERVTAALSARNLWALYQELLRRLPPLSLEGAGGPDGAPGPQLADPDPGSLPDSRLVAQEAQAGAARVRALLAEGLRALPARTRQVVELLVYRGLDGEAVRRVMGFRGRQRVYDEMARARRRLRTWLSRHGLGEVELREALADLAACQERAEAEPGSRSPAGVRPDGPAPDALEIGPGPRGPEGDSP